MSWGIIATWEMAFEGIKQASHMLENGSSAADSMEEGLHPHQAAERVVYEFSQKLEKRRGKAGAISIVCMNKEGEWGVGTNVEFTFVVATNKEEPKLYIANKAGSTTSYQQYKE